jgi:hypothetical protein
MQEFIKRLSFGVILIVLFFLLIGFVKEANAEDYSGVKELYIENEAGGVIAISQEACKDPVALKKGFEYKAYATEKDGTLHEGCWMAPDISEAPNVPGVRIIPIVNMYFDGQVIMVAQNQFKPFSKLDNSL